MGAGQEGNKQFFWAMTTNHIGAPLVYGQRHLLGDG